MINRRTAPVIPATRPGRRFPRLGLATLVWLMLMPGVAAPERKSLTVEEATDLAAAPAGDGGYYLHIAGRIWRLPAEGGEATALTTAEQIARRPAPSPDGRWLALEAVRNGTIQLLLSGPAGENPRQITDGPWNHLAPAWSADGQRLACASDRTGEFRIWEIEPESQTMRQLSFEPGTQFDPAWSPTGNAIAYVNHFQGRYSLVLRTSSAASQVLHVTNGALRGPSWRPDGSVITFSAELPQGPRLHMAILSDPPVVKMMAPGEAMAAAPVRWLDRNHFIYAADGRLRRREFGAVETTDIPFQAAIEVVTRGPTPARRLPDSGASPSVRTLAGIAPLPQGHVIGAALGDLWELDEAGALVRRLTDDDYVERYPAASADGRQLAFVSDRDGGARLWTLDLATGATRRVAAEDSDTRHPAWAPDGRRIAYLTGRAGSHALKLVAPETGAVVEIATGLAVRSGPAWMQDGRGIALLVYPSGDPQLLLFAIDRPGASRRVTLPAAAVGSAEAHLEFSADGQTLLVASTAGIYLLPVLDNGLVGADWRSLHAEPVHTAHWAPGIASAWFTDDTGLARAGVGEMPLRVAPSISWQPAGARGRSTIRAGRVFDAAKGAYRIDHDVVIEDGRIVAVEPWTAEPSGYFIDARDKTVMPGLIDVAIDLDGADGARPGRSLLAHGVTTVQAVNGSAPWLRDLAERWRTQRSGPRVLRLLHWCGADAALDDTGPVLVAGAVEICPQDEASAATGATLARSRGLAAWSSLWRAAASGLADTLRLPAADADPARSLIVGSGTYYQDAIDATIRSGVVLAPQLSAGALPLLLEDSPDLLASRQVKVLLADWRPDGRVSKAGRGWLTSRQRIISRISAGGGQIAAGSGNGYGGWGLGLHAELRALALSGIGNAAVLQAATTGAASALGLQEEIGSVEPGQIADLIIVGGDPLVDLRALQNVEAVLLDGELKPIDVLLDGVRIVLENLTQSASPTDNKPQRAHR